MSKEQKSRVKYLETVGFEKDLAKMIVLIEEETRKEQNVYKR